MLYKIQNCKLYSYSSNGNMFSFDLAVRMIFGFYYIILDGKQLFFLMIQEFLEMMKKKSSEADQTEVSILVIILNNIYCSVFCFMSCFGFIKCSTNVTHSGKRSTENNFYHIVFRNIISTSADLNQKTEIVRKLYFPSQVYFSKFFKCVPG